MATYLPQNKFMDSGTPRSPAVPDTAGVSPRPPDAPAGTIAACRSQNELCDPSAGLSGAPVQESPLAISEPTSNDSGAPQPRGEPAHINATQPAGSPNKPAPNEGRSREAPAGSAPPNTAAPAGADWEGSFWLVLDEVLAFPPIDLHEPPTFLIKDRVPGWI